MKPFFLYLIEEALSRLGIRIPTIMAQPQQKHDDLMRGKKKEPSGLNIPHSSLLDRVRYKGSLETNYSLEISSTETHFKTFNGVW